MFFLAYDLLLVVYFILILDYGNYVRQKANSYFLIWVQNGLQSGRDNCNVNSVFGPGAANECIVQWWFEKFCKGGASLRDEEHGGRPPGGDNDQLGGPLKLILLQPHKKLPKNPTSTIPGMFGIWSRSERWTNLDKWVPHELTENQKIVVLKCHLLLFYTTMNHFSFRLWWATERRLYMATGGDQLSGWAKRLQSTSKAKLPPT